MKLVFDFDDTVFDTERFKEERFYTSLSEYGVSREEFKSHYQKYRDTNPVYDIHLHLQELCAEKNIDIPVEDVVFSMVRGIDQYVFPEYKPIFEKYGRENIFILSQGSEHFQMLKIKHSEIEEKIEKAYIVAENKENTLHDLSLMWPAETILFFDNTVSNFHFERKEANIIPVFVGDPSLLSETDSLFLEENNIRICKKDEIEANIALFTKEAGIELADEHTREGRVI